MPKGSNTPVPATALRVEWLALRPRGAGRRRLGAASGRRKGPLRRGLRLLQPARPLLRRGPPRGQAHGRRTCHRHPAGRPRARGGRRRTDRPGRLGGRRDVRSGPGPLHRGDRRGLRRGGRPLRQTPARPWRRPSCSASSTAARAAGSSGPSVRATAAGSKASPRTSASPWTNRSTPPPPAAPARPAAAAAPPPPLDRRPAPAARGPARPRRPAGPPVQGDPHQGGPRPSRWPNRAAPPVSCA